MTDVTARIWTTRDPDPFAPDRIHVRVVVGDWKYEAHTRYTRHMDARGALPHLLAEMSIRVLQEMDEELAKEYQEMLRGVILR